jgi:hypothetical protein
MRGAARAVESGRQLSSAPTVVNVAVVVEAAAAIAVWAANRAAGRGDHSARRPADDGTDRAPDQSAANRASRRAGLVRQNRGLHPASVWRDKTEFRASIMP